MSPLQWFPKVRMLDLTTMNFGDLLLGSVKYLKHNPTMTMTSGIALLVAVQIYQSRRGLRTPRLRGPPSQSLLFGITKKLFPSSDIGVIYHDWERTYGPVYEIPASLGSRHVVLSDPKAIAHFFVKDTTTYYQPDLARAVSGPLFGDFLSAVEGETHKRQRRVLSGAFSISAMRDLTPVFLDCAYQLKAVWHASLELSNAVIIDVQKWMNHVSLDSLGNAGFSHDFGAIRGQPSPVTAAFHSVDELKPSLSMMLVFVLGPLFPNLCANIPNERWEKLAELAASLKVIAADLLNKASKETEDNDADRSILGVMVRSENLSSNNRLSVDEITTQIAMFMTAGYETTAATLTWAFIELARRPEIQETLRTELRSSITGGEDPTYDQLMNLPYLDAFTCELLRVHPPAPESMRVANEDDTIPLTDPIQTASGTIIDSLFVKKGTVIRIPIGGVNISEQLWGLDAETFDPDRWLCSEDEKKGRKEEVKGYRHLLSFIYGPRMCPGRIFAVTEVKVVLFVLVRNFAFEFPNGPSTKLGSHYLRPKVADEEGPKVPVLVRRVM